MPVLWALLVLPLVEIALFILVGGWIGLWPTLALVAGAGLAGAAVLRRTGLGAARGLRGPGGGLAAALMPVAEDAARMLAGVLLILPGFLSDAVAVVLLTPPLRRALIGWVAGRLGGRMGPTARRPARDMVIDGEFVELDGEGPPPRPPSHLTRH